MSSDANVVPRRFDEVTVGEELPNVTYRVQRADLIKYAGASGDFNAIHWNERVATSVGLPNVIAHGMYSMALAARLVADWAGDPGAVVEYGTRFTAPVPVPDDDEGAVVEAAGVVTALDDQTRTATVELTLVCQGAAVLGKARAAVRLS